MEWIHPDSNSSPSIYKNISSFMKLRYLLNLSLPILILNRKIRALFGKKYGYVKVLTLHNIPKEQFRKLEKIILYLKSKYNFITPKEFEEFIIAKQDLKGVNILLTFDDGFKSNRLVTEQILNPLKIKAIFFVPTKFLDIKNREEQIKFIKKQIYKGDIKNTDFNSGAATTDWDDLRYLIQTGHTIGSHTMTHQALSKIQSNNDLHYEIFESSNILKKNIGITIDHFAYPFGDINSINRQALKLIKQKYKYCFSGIRGLNNRHTNSYAILRDNISLNDPLLYSRFIIEKGLDFIYQKKAEQLLKLAEN